jgi:hypothetical protein
MRQCSAAEAVVTGKPVPFAENALGGPRRGRRVGNFGDTTPSPDLLPPDIMSSKPPSTIKRLPEKLIAAYAG